MPRQTIEIDHEASRAREIAELNNRRPESDKYVLVCRGTGLTVRATKLRAFFMENRPDGSIHKVSKPAPVIHFKNGWADVTEGGQPITKEIVEALKSEPGWAKDFYYHPRFCPNPDSKVIAEGIAGSFEEIMKDREIRKEMAKHFDKNAHPDKGVEDPINPRTNQPDSGGGWPGYR